ncbi:MAG: hypothetical protein ACFCGT_01375 [Sandaracinaceae bacterium]
MPLPTFDAYGYATLLDVTPAATEQAWLEVQPPPGWTDRYRHPGQFCRMRLGGDEGIFAMFSPPGPGPVRFLVRIGNPEGGECADRIAGGRRGWAVEMSPPAGLGFGLERARGGDLYFVATGTGVAPVHAALEAVLADRASYGRLCLDHGLRSDRHLAIRPAIERWRAAGVEVHVSYSRPDQSGGLLGTTVQQAIGARRPAFANASLVAVGQSAMLLELRALFEGLGGHKERFLTNY